MQTSKSSDFVQSEIGGPAVRLSSSILSAIRWLGKQLSPLPKQKPSICGIFFQLDWGCIGRSAATERFTSNMDRPWTVFSARQTGRTHSLKSNLGVIYSARLRASRQNSPHQNQ